MDAKRIKEALRVRLLPGALIVAGPPCSLHVAASQSVHKRSESRPMGDESFLSVRCSNRIWLNFVARLNCV